MTEPHKRSYRHPQDKTAYRVKNWREDEQSLRDRGDTTLWISQEDISVWRAPMSGKRGVQPIYAAVAIDTALVLRLETDDLVASLPRSYHAVTAPCDSGDTAGR